MYYLVSYLIHDAHESFKEIQMGYVDGTDLTSGHLTSLTHNTCLTRRGILKKQLGQVLG